ncbi:RHS repeat-associated protein [Anaerobacterium chartisolvens]|uniref:RHS repeat-associated protein n=1 Tax=Anaerobacterium chartisolvens TaxID=1297424 RepID=A0A369AFR0_9FIRM|nr:S8 family serine peptidase [Anaerobacterium chartisolvens]RCX08180.1 RHS repeat-associated protein [Anaerobacterium chartisolvens]
MKIKSFLNKAILITLIACLFFVPRYIQAADGTMLKAGVGKNGGISYSERKTDRFIIKYKNEKNRATEARNTKNGIMAANMPELKNYDVVTTKTRMKSSELLAEIENKSTYGIEYIQPDFEMTISSEDPQYTNQWGMYSKYSAIPDVNTLPDDEKIRQFILEDAKSMGLPSIRIDANVPAAWEKADGSGVMVAVLDTGIDITHEDISGNISVNVAEIPGNGIDDDGNGYIDDVSGWNFCDNNNTVHSKETECDEWHGSHVAGIIAASKDNGKGIAGVAPAAKVLPLKVFKGGRAYTSDIIAAIQYAGKMGAKVVNCSWGSTEYNQALKDAIEHSDMLFVCAAGNSHTDIDNNPVYPAAFDCKNIITAASIDKNGVLSGFSNYGKASVDIAAPGNEIISTLPGNAYGKSSGSSMAAAFVSGEAALLSDMLKGISIADLKNRIINSSDRLSSLTDKLGGGGKLNCGNAVSGINKDEIVQIAFSDNDPCDSSSQPEQGYELLATDSWAGKASMPTARHNFGSAETGGFIYAIGGNKSTYLNTVEEYDPVLNNWKTKAAMPTVRECLSVVAAYGKIYAIGGYNGNYLNTVEEYDPASDKWIAKAGMNTARQSAGACVVNGKIYVIGGYNGNYLNTVEEYNPLTNSWRTLASMSAPRSQLGVAAVNGKVYAVGGYYLNQYLNTVQEYDPSTNVWAGKRAMPTARGSFGVSVVNSKIYAVGGICGSGCLNNAEEYNPALDTWIAKTPMQIGKCNISTTSVNGRIYIMGGYNAGSLSSTEEYTPASDVWVTKAPMPTARGFAGVAAIDGRIYVAGGTYEGSSALEYKAINTFEEYDTEKNTWSVKPSMPTPRFGVGGASAYGEFYAIGGWNWDINGNLDINSISKDTVEAYNPATGRWVSKASMGSQRFAPGVVELDGKIYAIGGAGQKSAEVYNPLTNRWTPIADMSEARYGLAVAAVNGKIYVMGGYDYIFDKNLSDTVEEYNPSTNTWTKKASMPTKRNYMGAVAVNGKIYIIGGNSGKYINNVDIYDPATDRWTTGTGMSVGRMRLGTVMVNGRIYAIGGYNGSYLSTVEEYSAEYDRYIMQTHFGEDGTNPASGNFSRSYTDMSMDVPGFKLNIGRTYNSRNDKSGPLGKGWTFSFEGNIKDDPNDSTLKVVTLPDGSVQTFKKSKDAGSNDIFTAKDSRSRLELKAGGSYVLTTKDQYSYTFINGWLTLMQDKFGNTVSISVDSNGKISKITDIAERSITVDYSGTSFIRFVKDVSGGRTVEYQYENNQLVRAIDPAGNITRYSYDSSGYMNGVKDHNSNRIEDLVYNHSAGDNQHKVSRITDAYGNIFKYAYDNANKEASITDSNGRQTVQHYDSYMYTSSSRDAEGKEEITEYNLDINGGNRFGEERAVTDRNGNKTAYDRDGRGNITKITNPDGSTIEYTYDAKNNVISEKNEQNKYTFYIYDAGMVYLLKKIEPLNGTDLYYQGCDESKFAITGYTYYTSQECQSNGYKAKGLLKENKSPEGKITAYTYYSNGCLKTEKDAQGKTTVHNYNSIGWETSTISPMKFKTEYFYDNNGRLEKTVANDGDGSAKPITTSSVTRTTYNIMGRKTQEVSPNLYDPAKDSLTSHTYTGNHGYRYVYNADYTLKRVTDPENNVTEYLTYDMYGNVLKEKKPNGAVYEYAYDALNRIKKVYFRENASASSTLLEEYSYDIVNGTTLQNGAILKNTRKTRTVYLNDKEAAVTKYIYDYAGRLINQQNADGTSSSIEYYLDGRVKSTTDESLNKTYYKYGTYDSANNFRYDEKWALIEKSGSDALYTYSAVVYDKTGRIKSEKTGKQKVSLWNAPSDFVTKTYEYYGNDKVYSITFNDGRKTQYQYDDDGNVSREEVYTDSTNKRTTLYENNQFGLPCKKKVYVKLGDIYDCDFSSTFEILPTTELAYDKNGNLKSVKTPEFVTTIYEYDNMDRRTSTSQSGYDEYMNAAVISASTLYNWEGKPIEATDTKGNKTFYHYNARGFLEKVEETAAVNGADARLYTLYGYDNAGRKIYEVSPKNYFPGQSVQSMDRTEYTYDLMGRIKTQNEVFREKTVDPGDNSKWITSWVTITSKAYKYDSMGNIVKELDSLGYEAGTGTTADQKINTGYGTVYTYNCQGKVQTVLDPVSKDRGLAYSTKYEYDGMGRKVYEISAKGSGSGTYYSSTGYEYDDAGNVTEVRTKKNINDTGSSGQLVQVYTYDLMGNLLTRKDGNSNVTTFEYNAMGKLRKVIYPGDASIPSDIVIYQYDLVGNLKKQQNSLDTVDLYTYDNQGRVLSHTQKKKDSSQTITTSIRYDKNGNKRFETDGNGVKRENTYDQADRLISTKITVTGERNRKTQKVTSYEYDANGNATVTTDWRGNRYTSEYDPINRLIEKSGPYGVIQKLEYNHNSSQKISYDALYNITAFEYDKDNRLINTIDPEGHISLQSYDNAGNIGTRTDGRGNKTTYAYDEFNRLEKVTDATGQETSYSYDLNGNMLTQTDAKGNTIAFEYNVRNKAVKRIDAGGRTGEPGSYTYDSAKVEKYTYYADGSLYTKEDRNGKMTAYEYDCHGRMLSQSVNGEAITYTYDRNGNQLEITDSAGKTTRTYDEQGRVRTKAVPNIGTIEFRYDIIADMDPGCWAETSIDPKGNTITKIYDSEGRLWKVASEGKETIYSYYGNGSKKGVEYSSGAREEYTYYKDGMLAALKNYVMQNGSEKLIDSYAYEYDAARNQISKDEYINGSAKGTTVYEYDSLNRLKSVTEPGSSRTTVYTYDAAGNRQTEKVTENDGTVSTQYNYNPQNRLDSTVTGYGGGIEETVRYSYDNNGNMTYKGVETTKPYDETGEEKIEVYAGEEDKTDTDIAFYMYDDWNQLVEISAGGQTSKYLYNGEGLRVGKEIGGKTTRYLYEYDNIILEVDGEGNQTGRNVYGTNLLMREVEGETLFYLYNGHGDVTSLVDTAGRAKVSYYYDAFGNILEQSGSASNSITYAGYQYDDETGLYYLRSRMYDPVTARFMQEDTYMGQASDPLSLNLYTYCHNEPIMYVDPTGHKEELDKMIKSSATKTAIDKATKAYEQAKAKNDKAGMAKAHDDAQKARSEYAKTSKDAHYIEAKYGTSALASYLGSGSSGKSSTQGTGKDSSPAPNKGNDALKQQIKTGMDKQLNNIASTQGTGKSGTSQGTGKSGTSQGTGNPKLGFDSLSNYKTRDQWGANPVNEKVGVERIKNPNQYFDSVVIHHTERATDEEIKHLQKYFQDDRKYPDIGYHYIIGGGGTIYEGMPINLKGWHVEKNNTGKIGVVLTGNFNDGSGISGNVKDAINWLKGEGHTEPSKEQIESLKQLIKVLDSQYGIDKVGGHKDFALSTSPSECPGNIAYPILEKEGIIKLGK